MCLGCWPWLHGEGLQTHLLPFDACGSCRPWRPLCDKKPCMMPSICLGHSGACHLSTSHLVLLPRAVVIQSSLTGLPAGPTSPKLP